jgi:hypothetical protein
MKRLIPDTNVMILTEDYNLISHDKAIVKLEAGCVWVHLLEDNRQVGAAFIGPSNFAVDAIAETKIGAMGESVTGSLEGVQLYIGNVSFESISKIAEDSDLQKQGFKDAQSFVVEIESTIKDQLNGDHSQTRIDQKEQSQIFFGRDSEKVKLIIVLSKEKGLVFTYKKQVFVLGDDSMVSVSKSGVIVTGKNGKQLIVGKSGIHGLDSIMDIGPIVTESVTEAMKSLKGLKSLKSMKQTMKDFPYDNVDDFDWDD